MSGVTLTATALAGMVLGCAVVGGVGQVALVRSQVDAAADLAALAAAAQLARGDPGDVACAVAARVAVGTGGGGPAGGRSSAGGAAGGPAGGPAGGAPGGTAGEGPQVVGCVVAGVEVTVRVAAPVRVLGLEAVVEGRARAGPVLPG